MAVALAIALPAVAQPAGGDPQDDAQRRMAKPAQGTVYTYYGLRKLELDPSVSDEEKLTEWEAFITRANDQIAYAKAAVERWKNAARLRVIESVQNDDRDPKLTPRDKKQRWERLVKLYPRSREARTAKRRIAHWRAAETKRLVEAAEEVERSGAPKVERVKAWQAVADWVAAGPEARAARKRIKALQDQLFAEAKSLDRIGRVDGATKLAVWKDVLAASPTAAQRRTAERRVRELEAAAAAPK